MKGGSDYCLINTELECPHLPPHIQSKYGESVGDLNINLVQPSLLVHEWAHYAVPTLRFAFLSTQLHCILNPLKVTN